MNTYIVIDRTSVSTARMVELTAYAALAVLLIGQILLGNGAVSLADVMLVYVGAIAGLLFSCQAAPASAGMQRAARAVRIPHLAGLWPFRRRKSGARMDRDDTGGSCTA